MPGWIWKDNWEEGHGSCFLLPIYSQVQRVVVIGSGVRGALTRASTMAINNNHNSCHEHRPCVFLALSILIWGVTRTQ